MAAHLETEFQPYIMNMSRRSRVISPFGLPVWLFISKQRFLRPNNIFYLRATMSYLQLLKTKWNLKSTWQVLMVLVVFAFTGFTVMWLKEPVVGWITGGEQNMWLSILYYILILPIYNMILLFYGFIFGQFTFFWNFEKRFLARLSGKIKK